MPGRLFLMQYPSDAFRDFGLLREDPTRLKKTHDPLTRVHQMAAVALVPWCDLARTGAHEVGAQDSLRPGSFAWM